MCTEKVAICLQVMGLSNLLYYTSIIQYTYEYNVTLFLGLIHVYIYICVCVCVGSGYLVPGMRGDTSPKAMKSLKLRSS